MINNYKFFVTIIFNFLCKYPFNPETTISYELPFDSKVTLKIFNVIGKEVSSIIKPMQSAGYHTLKFSGKNLPSGIYFYKLITESKNETKFTQTKKMMLVK